MQDFQVEAKKREKWFSQFRKQFGQFPKHDMKYYSVRSDSFAIVSWEVVADPKERMQEVSDTVRIVAASI